MYELPSKRHWAPFLQGEWSQTPTKNEKYILEEKGKSIDSFNPQHDGGINIPKYHEQQ